MQFNEKERDTSLGDGRFRTNIPGGTLIGDASGAGVPGYTDPAVTYTLSNIKRTNIDPYVQLERRAGRHSRGKPACASRT